MRSSLTLLACLVSALTLVPRLLAQAPATLDAPGAAPSESPREALIDRGIALREQARDEEALRVFQQAFALGRDGRVLAQIAFAEQAMGRWADAYLHLTASLAERADPWVEEHRALLASELQKVAQSVGRLDVRTNVAVAKLTVDGKEVGITPLSEPLIVTAGSVVVSAQASGYLPTTRHVTIYAGALSRTELVLVPEPTVARAASSERGRRVVRNPAWLYVAGAGALTALSSIGPWVRASRLYDALRDDCSQPGSCLTRYPRDDAKIGRLDHATTALLAGGLTISAAATATYFLWTQREAPRVAPSAWLAPRAAGVEATLRY